jgi:hypothetical protein
LIFEIIITEHPIDIYLLISKMSKKKLSKVIILGDSAYSDILTQSGKNIAS